MNHFNPHKRQGKRYRTFTMFMDELCLQLVGNHRSSSVVRTTANRQDAPQRLQDVGLHLPQISPQATGNNLCVVCSFKYNKHVQQHPNMAYKDRPIKKVKTKFWCTYCQEYLCIKEGSTCWEDFHRKVQYWR